MLVDDSDDDRILMRAAFKMAGVTNPVREMDDVKGAIEYLSGRGDFADGQHYPLPCLIILDLVMPGVDGFALLKWLQERPEFYRVPKIVLAGEARERDEDRARQLGCWAYFCKPNQLGELVKLVVQMDEEWISKHCPVPDAGKHLHGSSTQSFKR
jgi:CheY-like chemotaxis protein